MRERIKDWLSTVSQPKSLKDIQKRFHCSKSTARVAALEAVKQDMAAICILGREYHFSKKEK